MDMNTKREGETNRFTDRQLVVVSNIKSAVHRKKNRAGRGAAKT